MIRSMGAAGLRWTRATKDGMHFSTRLVSGHTKDSPCNGGIGSEEDPHEETVTINRRQPLESGITNAHFLGWLVIAQRGTMKCGLEQELVTPVDSET